MNKQNLSKMKTLIIFFAFSMAFSSCIVELEMDPPYIEIGTIDEYETKEVIRETWSGGILIYEEVQFHSWLDIEFQNVGGLRADNVWAEVIFYNRQHEIQTISIHLPDIHSGYTYTYSLDTGFESMYDYTDYAVDVYWE